MSLGGMREGRVCFGKGWDGEGNMASACGIASLFVCLCTLEEFRSGGEILAQRVFVQMSVINASGILGLQDL